MLKHPPETYAPMSEKEVRDAMDIAVRMNLHRLPQLKGTGKVVDVQVRALGAKHFSDALVDHLLMANFVMMRGPPTEIAPSTEGNRNA